MQHPVRCATPGCDTPIAPSRRLYCSKPCSRRATYLRNRDAEISKAVAWNRSNLPAKKRRRTAQRLIAARYKRPRCVVCSGPINWSNPNVNNDTRTCGKRPCTWRALAWFGPMKPRSAA